MFPAQLAQLFSLPFGNSTCTRGRMDDGQSMKREPTFAPGWAGSQEVGQQLLHPHPYEPLMLQSSELTAWATRQEDSSRVP